MKNVKDYNPVFTKVYRFMEKHLNVTTDHDFEVLVCDLEQFASKFEIDIAVAIVAEIERVYQAARQ